MKANNKAQQRIAKIEQQGVTTSIKVKQQGTTTSSKVKQQGETTSSKAQQGVARQNKDNEVQRKKT
jgi:hypothetical protein